MNPVIVRNVKIGEGIPKICVPIVGITAEEILTEAENIKNIPKDLVEWRADWYEAVFDLEKVEQTLYGLREILGEIPLLFTFRTAEEGGEKEIAEEDYLKLNQMAAESGCVDLIDVEVFRNDETVHAIIAGVHENGVKVVASNHDFQKTPPQEEIVRRLRYMQDMGADILKIAVMPRHKKDVLTLLAATEEMKSTYAHKPIVTMSMSGKGLVSRLSGEIFGSAITFGSAKKASAPGQIPAEKLKKILEIVNQFS